MRNRIPITILLLMLVSVRSFAKAIDVNVVTFDYPPYMYEVIQNKKKGMEIDILEAALKGSNYKLNYKFYPIYRAVNETLTRNPSQITVYVGTSLHFTDQIKDKSVKSIYIGRASFMVYMMKDSPVAKLSQFNFQTLKPYRLVAPLGSSIVKVLKDHQITPNEVVEFPSLFMMVERGRADAAMALDITADEFLAKDPAKDRIIKSPEPVYQIPLAIVVKTTPDSEKVYKAIEAGVERIRENGTLRKIAEKYFIKSKIPSNFFNPSSD